MTKRSVLNKILFLLISLTVSFNAQANYQAGHSYFSRGDYVTAAAQYFNAYSAPRNKAEKRKAEWRLAQSLQKLGLLYSASKYYSIIVRRGRRADNPFFRDALEELGKINFRISLGQAHVTKLFKAKISSSDVPSAARGFYFYYKGIEAFTKDRLEQSLSYFKKVPSRSPYYMQAVFHLGVVSNLSGRHGKAINYFEKVVAMTRGRGSLDELRESAWLNIARIHFEKKRFTRSIAYYGRVSRDSDNWLEALWESSWAFFYMQKFNNTLGNIHTIHSPFFSNRFYPEAYILQAITFLRLCDLKEVKKSLKSFQVRYKSTFGDIKKLLKKYKYNPKGLYKLVDKYGRGKRIPYRNAEEVIQKLSTVDAYKESQDTMRFASRELQALRRYSVWGSSGLLEDLRNFLNSKKKAGIKNAGRRMYGLALQDYKLLVDLSSQTKLIKAEVSLKRLQRLRNIIRAGKANNDVQFIGGLQKLNINQTLEYWPFEGEYWEDELGFYVYNLESQCSKRKKSKSK